jgi:penicillin V acylase-like amidase (Ntn superfamily)
MIRRTRLLAATALAGSLLMQIFPTFACSLVFVNDNDVAKIVVRTMDLPLSIPEAPRLVVFPRGMEKDAGRSLLPGVTAKLVGLGDNHLKWKAKYGSVAMSAFDIGVTDGLNEQGLAGHLLTLETTAYEPKDARPELGQSHWLAYVLDNFKSVQEAVDALQDNKKFRIVPATVPEKGLTGVMSVHLALEDPTGDSAVFELVDGKMVIHHGPQYRVLTNDPPYDAMLSRMKKYKAFGGTLGLPGEAPEGEYRFVRLAAYYKLLPEPKSYRQAVANAISLMRIAQVPVRDPAKEILATRDVSDADRLWAGVQTNWLSAIDVSHKVVYVNSAISPDLFWLKLDDLDLNEGAPVVYLDPHEISLGGDVAKRFAVWKSPVQ